MVDGKAGVDEPDDQVVVVVAPLEKRTQERAEKLADGLLQLLLNKVLAGTANASEMKVAADYIKEAGIRLIVGPTTKAGELERVLPKLPPIDASDRFTRTG